MRRPALRCTRRAMDRLVLFDIDCTLIDAHGAGGRAIVGAIRDIYGVEGELGDYSFHGRTDPGIIRDLAELWGAGDPEAIVGRYEGETQPQVVHDLAEQLGAPDDVIDALTGACIERYVELLPARSSAGQIEVLPGIKELVTALAADRRAVVGLLTGNVVEGARIKLQPTGLYPLFKVGAFGSDSALRAELPAVAVARAEELDRPALRRQGDRRHRRHAGRRGVRRRARRQGDRRRHRPAHRGPSSPRTRRTTSSRTSATGAPPTRPSWPDRDAAPARSPRAAISA